MTIALTMPNRTARNPTGILIRVGIIALLACVPLFGSTHMNSLFVEAFIFAIFAMSLDLLLGYTGLNSFGHAAFLAVGAYVTVILGTMFDLSTWIVMPLGVLAAAAAAAVVGYFCTRTGGITFLMVTLAFSQLIYSVALKWRSVTGGSDGIGGLARPSFFGFSLSDPTVMYYAGLVFVLGTYFALARIIASPLGRTFIGIRENEQRMRSIGYATPKYKVLSFTIAGAFGGVAGALYALFNGFVSPELAYWSMSGEVLIMLVLGGAGTLVGPAVGAFVFIVLKSFVSSHTEHWMMFIGIIFVCCVMFFRKGIVGSLIDFFQSRRAAS